MGHRGQPPTATPPASSATSSTSWAWSPPSGLRSRARRRGCWSAGVVTHRQRPATAAGTMFLNLEDETGLINVICSRGLWPRYRTVARTSPALLVRGRARAGRGRHQRDRRPLGTAPSRRSDPLPRLPLTTDPSMFRLQI